MATGPVTLLAKGTAGLIDTIQLDVVKTEQHTMTSTVTDHPVEDGANVSDHSRPEPLQLQLECIVSNTPLTGSSSKTVTSGGAKFTTTGAELDARRAKNAYDRLVALREAGTLVTVVTSLREYTSMAIMSVTIPRDNKTTNGLHCTVAFKQIRVVKNKLTRAVVAKDKRAGSKIKTGQQTMVFTEAELYGQQSALDKAYEAYKGGFGNGAFKGLSGLVGGG